MKKTGFLRIGIIVSAFIHIFMAASIFEVSKIEITDDEYQKSRFVEVQILKPEPPPPPPPPPQKKIEKKPDPPVSHIKKEAEQVEEVKPVFGVTKKTVDEMPTEGIGVRVGNTLMKEMEEEYTPPDQVKDYAGGSKLEERKKVEEGPKFTPVPNTELAIMPRAINPVKPKYPKKLEEDEIEGEVVLELSISKEGKVINIKVLESDHKLFSEAALATVRNYRFTPGKTKDGTPVDAVIEFTITFEMPL